MAFTLTAAGNGNGVYTGTITGGGTNLFVGYGVTIAGFATSANNGTFIITANTTTTITTSNSSSATETHAGTATLLAFATSTFTINAYPKGAVEVTSSTAGNVHLYGTLVISASPAAYPANGVPVTLTGVGVYHANTPYFATIYGIAGYEYVYDILHNTIRAYLGGTEVVAGAVIPAAVSGDTIYVKTDAIRS